MSSTGVTLSGSYTGETGTVSETGFYYGTTSGSLGSKVSAGGVSSSFSKKLTGLATNTIYYYKAYVVEDGIEVLGTERQVTIPTHWLEVPAVSGTEDFVGKFYGSGSTAGTNRNYSYYYNYTYYASMWVAYPLCSTHKSGTPPSGSWSYNPDISSSSPNRQVKVTGNSYPTMYNADAYARGHQCPNASRKSDSQMNAQTYYVTNQTPQLQNKFNASVWSSLETAVRDLTTSATDTVYVVTGPAYRKAGGSEAINYLTGAAGKSANPASLPIPNYYWKAILKVKRNGNGIITDAKAIGFWFNHREYTSSEHYDDSSNIVSVDQIESWTGFNLFANLPSGLQTTAEANTSWSSFQSF